MYSKGFSVFIHFIITTFLCRKGISGPFCHANFWQGIAFHCLRANYWWPLFVCTAIVSILSLHFGTAHYMLLSVNEEMWNIDETFPSTLAQLDFCDGMDILLCNNCSYIEFAICLLKINLVLFRLIKLKLIMVWCNHEIKSN